MPLYEPESSLKCKPLTKVEKAWCVRLEKILMSAPKRFELATVGDPDLAVVDIAALNKAGIEHEEQNASEAGMALCHIRSAVSIAGLCG